MDAFAVSIAAGLSMAPVTARQTFRLAFHFGLFQFMMPIFGWLVGKELVAYVGGYDRWVAFGLLALVGGKMLLDARGQQDPKSEADPTRGLMLVGLSVATSIDAFAVGLSMAFVHVSIWIPSVAIGVVAATLSTIGISCGSRLGSRLGPRWGRRAKIVGGAVLILIGITIAWPPIHASTTSSHSSSRFAGSCQAPIQFDRPVGH